MICMPRQALMRKLNILYRRLARCSARTVRAYMPTFEAGRPRASVGFDPGCCSFGASVGFDPGCCSFGACELFFEARFWRQALMIRINRRNTASLSLAACFSVWSLLIPVSWRNSSRLLLTGLSLCESSSVLAMAPPEGRLTTIVWRPRSARPSATRNRLVGPSLTSKWSRDFGLLGSRTSTCGHLHSIYYFSF